MGKQKKRAKTRPNTPKRNRAPKQRAHPQNFYTRLGVSKDERFETIRSRYHELLREHPPESDPEGFQRIREAYYTLSDPVRRKTYDLVLKYGVSLSEALDEGHRLAAAGQRRLARGQARLALSIAPDSVEAHLLMAFLAPSGEECRNEVEKAVALTPGIEDKIGHLITWAKWAKSPDQTLARLAEIEARFPAESPRLLARVRFNVYQVIWEDRKAMAAFRSILNLKRRLTAKDIDFYRQWIDAILDTDPENVTAVKKVLGRLKSHWDRGDPRDDLSELDVDLMARAQAMKAEGQYVRAAAYLRIASWIQPGNLERKKFLSYLMQWAQITAEFGSFYFDERVPEPVRNAVFQLIAKETGAPLAPPPHPLFGFLDPFGGGRERTAGDVQKTYPAIYAAFSERVDFGTKGRRTKNTVRQLEFGKG